MIYSRLLIKLKSLTEILAYVIKKKVLILHTQNYKRTLKTYNNTIIQKLDQFSIECRKYSFNYFGFGFGFTTVWEWLSSLIGKLIGLVLVLRHSIENHSKCY